MRRRWYYWKRTVRANRPVIVLAAAVLLLFAVIPGRADAIGEAAEAAFREYGVRAAHRAMKEWFPTAGKEEKSGVPGIKSLLLSYLETMERQWEPGDPEDPAYDRILAERWSGSRSSGGAEGQAGASDGANGVNAGGAEGKAGASDAADGANAGGAAGQTGFSDAEDGANSGTAGEQAGDSGQAGGLIGEVISMKPSGSAVIREKLADFDYVMQSFYSVHPTTTAGRDLIDADRFLNMDLSISKEPDAPQILIYHTHSQEEFADYPENPEAKITGVGACLAELLEQKGYGVIHDASVYDLKDGTLDRSQAYTYALDGINGILQEYPSIQVVLDVHRDGVSSGTHLVTEVNGKPTAQIMFFNGTSQTPDGPIEYLPNPNRDGNLAFSFQMQLKAAEQYPGFTRKIYLKGLRYNLHVRARSALIEVGAQTNTYEEARNAMEPLADLIDQVLRGE